MSTTHATRITLGIDGTRRAISTPSAAETLVRRLRFPDVHLDAVHVLPPFPYAVYSMDAGLATEVVAEAEQDRREAGQEMIEQSAARLRQQFPEAQQVVPYLRDGSAAAELIQHADEASADLIAVGGPHTGPFAALLTGSVARGLVIGSHRSLLLAKEPPQAVPPLKESIQGENAPVTVPEPVRAVFATDHSPYADRCLTELLRLAPRGIEHLTVLTVFPEHDLQGLEVFLPTLPVGLDSTVRKALEAKNDAVVERLEPLLNAAGATVDARVLGDPVNDAITATMQNTQSDLLIVGAKGHSLVERVTVGSVSFHQAMTEPYSLLILRP